MRNFKALYFLFYVLLLFIKPSAAYSQAEKKLDVWTVYFRNLKGIDVPAYCEVAASEEDKRRGLMFREKLGNDECMIFVYDDPIMLTFWMRNTLIPLSIAFVDDKLSIIDIFDMKPHDDTIISSTLPGKYAIETNRGWFKKNYIFQGVKARIEKEDLRARKHH